MMSRRQALAGIAAVLAGSSTTAETAVPTHEGGPVFSPLGPDANHYGAAEGFPVRLPIEEPGNRVGAFSNFDALFPTRQIRRAAVRWDFKHSSADIHYLAKGVRYSLTDY